MDVRLGANLVVEGERCNDQSSDESNEVSVSGADLIGKGSNDRRDSVRSAGYLKRKRSDNEWKVAHRKFRLFGVTFDVTSHDASNIAKHMSSNPNGARSFHQGYDSLKEASPAGTNLASTDGGNDALKKPQINGVTVQNQKEISTTPSYCRLLPKYLPDFLIQGCLRCLDLSNIDVRYSIT